MTIDRVLSLSKETTVEPVVVQQNDRQSRTLRLYLLEQGSRPFPTEGVQARLLFRKNGATSPVYEAAILPDGWITLTIPEAVTQNPGSGEMQLVLRKEDSLLHSFTLPFTVKASLSFVGEVESPADDPMAVNWKNLPGKPAAFPPAAHTHAPEEAGALPADGTAKDAQKLGGKTPGTYRTAKNWLDNSSFLIDQRGKGTYTATGYSLDRWRFRTVSGGGGSVTKLARGIRIDVGDGGLHGMYQRIATQEASDKFLALAGRPVTLAVKVAASTLVASGNCGIDLLDHNNATVEGSNSTVLARKTFAAGSTGIFVANGTMPETMTYAGITALFRTPSGESSGAIDLEWMALYEGTYTADTLPEYVEPDYARELLECQRYYFRTAGQGWGYCTGTAAARLNVPVAVEMRALPSVDDDTITFTCHNEGSNITATGFSPAEMVGAAVRLNLSCDNLFTKFTPLAGYASAPFGFSAEL